MDFAQSDEQQAVVELATRFADKELAPSYSSRDEGRGIERSLVRKMGELGLIGLELPQTYGGMGLSHVTAGLVLEAIAGADFSFGYFSIMSSLCGQIVARHAGEEICGEWLPRIFAGECITALGLTEPRVGSDATNIALKAQRKGNYYVLDGEKASISFAGQADLMCAFVRTGAQEQGSRGITALLVPLDLPGITRSEYNDVGTRGVGRGSVFFDQVRVPDRFLLGEPERGFGPVMQGFDYSRALIGLQCLAVARRSLDESWAYASERQAFGKSIASFQGVAFPLAEAETQLSAARLLCLNTLWLRDQELPHTSEAAMCKWWAPKLSFDIIHNCLLTHGHGGYSRDYPHQQRLRDVLGFEIGDGTAQIMKMIIARQKVGRAAASD